MNIRLWAMLPAIAMASAPMNHLYAAENKSTKAKQPSLEEMVVSASPIHGGHSDNASPISVLNGNELRTKAAATLAETLAGQAGVSTSSFGPGVGNPVIRGQSGARVKVMQDNLDTLDVSATSADHANTTEPLLADQVEILRGPATLRFGSGAIGGVVNVIDSRIPRELSDDPISGAIETRHSSVNDETATVMRLDGSTGNFAWHMDGVYRDSNDTDVPGIANHEDPEDSTDGYIENSDSKATAFSIGGSWFGERGMIGLSVNHQNNEYGIPPGAHEHHHEEEDHDEHDDDDHDEDHGDEDHAEEEGHEDGALVRIDMQQTRYDLKGELLDPIQGFEKLSVRLGHNDYKHRELEGDEVGTVFTNKALEGRVEMVHKPINGWHGAIGLQWLDRDFSAVGEEAFVPNAEIQSYGLFLIEEYHWEGDHPQWLEWGLRVEQQTIDPDALKSEDHTSTSGSIAYHWSPLEQHHFSVSLSLAERAPTLEELFSNGVHVATQSFEIGDTNLDSERSQNLDLGYEWHPETEGGLLQAASVNVFYNQIDDYIYARNTGVEDPEEEVDIFQYTQEDARFTGLEAEATLRLNDNFSVRLFGDHVRAKLDKGGDIPRTTPSRAGTELRYEQEQMSASLQWLKAAKQNNPGTNEEETSGYEQLDASIQWHLNAGNSPIMVFVRGNNLLDEEIRHATSFLRDLAPAAGRNISTGIRIEF